jgi:DNA-directed RNA polymerase subunit RPC12/RpoP
MTRLTYKCSKCSWEKSLPQEWGDLRPRMCGNKNCLTSFYKEPDALQVLVPKKPEVVQPEAPKEEKPRNWKNKNERRDQE